MHFHIMHHRKTSVPSRLNHGQVKQVHWNVRGLGFIAERSGGPRSVIPSAGP